MEGGAPGAHGAVVGVDIGGTTTRAVAFDGDLAVTGSVAGPTPSGAGPISDAVAGLVAALVDGRRPSLVAVGIPGRVDVAAGTVSTAVNLGIGAPAPIAAMLATRVGTAVHVENDVNAAALGTFADLGMDAASSLAYVNVGTGIAAGFVVDGRLVRGATGGAGEIGHVPMRSGAPACRCGQVGCAEAIGSGRAVAARPDRHDDVLAAAAWVVQLCVMTLDVDIVAVGGGMTEGPTFVDALRAALRAREAGSPMLATAGLARRVRHVVPTVRAGSLGAVLAARQRDAGR